MHYYDVLPLTVPADQVSEIRIHPRFKHSEFKRESPWKIEVVNSPGDGITENGIMPGYVWGKPDGIPVEWNFTENGDLCVRTFFAGEQEHNIQVICTRSDNPDYFLRRSFKIYSLKLDLLGLRPWKGETHAHTTGSDGKEEPRYVAARYRQKGYDFMAVTDHFRFEPSEEAASYWKNLTPDFTVLHGEEVHAPGNPVHIVNLGGERSVNDIYRADEEKYRGEVEKIKKELPPGFPDEIRFAAASCRWVFGKIRSVGGLAVYCHPFWRMPRTVLPQPLIDAVFSDRRFDAVEILGGFYREQFEANNFQIVRCLEERVEHGTFPVLGASDSHGTNAFPLNRPNITPYNGLDVTLLRDAELFGWYFTVVLAKDNSREELLSAVRKGLCAAVEMLPGSVPHIYGDSRLVRYVSFLLRCYFPLHDHFCAEQGNAMLDYLAGEDWAEKNLALLRDRVKKRMSCCFYWM